MSRCRTLGVSYKHLQAVLTLLCGDRGWERAVRVMVGGGDGGGDGVGLLVASSKQGRFSPQQSITTSDEIRSLSGSNLVRLMAL